MDYKLKNRKEYVTGFKGIKKSTQEISRGKREESTKPRSPRSIEKEARATEEEREKEIRIVENE